MTNATGLPISTGVSGLAAGVATFLGTPSSANLASALTDETGTGAAVFGTAPTFTTSINLGAANIITDTTTGTKIGTATNQKLGFFNVAPVVQQTGNVCTAMQNLGLVASCTESGGGTITGSGVANYMTNWTGSTSIGTSNITTNASSYLGIGTSSPLVSLDDNKNTDAIAFPVGTSGTRPTALAGYSRYNSTANTKGWLESWSTLGTAAWAVLQPLVGGGLETTNSGSTNATNLQNQINSMISLGTSSLSSNYGVAGIQIPRGTYPMGAGIATEPWIKLQTSGTVKLDYSSVAALTAATNNTTAIGNAVLHFASLPAGAIAGALVVDNTHSTYLPAYTMVVSTTSTTVTLSQNATTQIGNGDTISFSPIGMNVTNDNTVSGDANTFNADLLSPFVNANDGTLLMNGPGYTSNTIGMMLGSASTSPGTDNNVREVSVSGLSIQNFNTCLRLKPDSLYLLKFINGGDISNCGHGIDTATYPSSNVNSGENMSFRNWVIGNNTVGMYFDTTNIDTTCDGCSFDNNTTGIISTANDGYAKHAYINSHIENNSPVVSSSAPTNDALYYIFHGDKFVYTSTTPAVQFTGYMNLDLDGVYFSYANVTNSPTNLFMAAANVTPVRMSHIYWQAYTQAQLTSPLLLANDDPCFSSGTNTNDLTTAPMPTYSTALGSTGAGANTGITATVSNSVVWTTGTCSTSKSLKFVESNTTNSYTVSTDRFPVQAGQQLAMDVVFQTNTATSNALLNTEYVYTPCNPSLAATAEGFYGDTLKNDGTNNTWLKMNYVNLGTVPANACYAQAVINLSGLAASEVIYIGFIGVNIE